MKQKSGDEATRAAPPRSYSRVVRSNQPAETEVKKMVKMVIEMTRCTDATAFAALIDHSYDVTTAVNSIFDRPNGDGDWVEQKSRKVVKSKSDDEPASKTGGGGTARVEAAPAPAERSEAPRVEGTENRQPLKSKAEETTKLGGADGFPPTQPPSVDSARGGGSGGFSRGRGGFTIGRGSYSYKPNYQYRNSCAEPKEQNEPLKPRSEGSREPSAENVEQRESGGNWERGARWVDRGGDRGGFVRRGNDFASGGGVNRGGFGTNRAGYQPRYNNYTSRDYQRGGSRGGFQSGGYRGRGAYNSYASGPRREWEAPPSDEKAETDNVTSTQDESSNQGNGFTSQGKTDPFANLHCRRESETAAEEPKSTVTSGSFRVEDLEQGLPGREETLNSCQTAIETSPVVKLFDSVLSQPLNSSMTCTYDSKPITVETPTVQFHEKIEGYRAEGVEFGWTEQAPRPPMAFHLPPTYQAPAVELPLPVMPDVTSKKFLPRPPTAPPPVFLRSDLPQTPLALPPPPAFQEPRAPSPPQEQPRSSSFALPTPFPFYNSPMGSDYFSQLNAILATGGLGAFQPPQQQQQHTPVPTTVRGPMDQGYQSYQGYQSSRFEDNIGGGGLLPTVSMVGGALDAQQMQQLPTLSLVAQPPPGFGNNPPMYQQTPMTLPYQLSPYQQSPFNTFQPPGGPQIHLGRQPGFSPMGGQQLHLIRQMYQQNYGDEQQQLGSDMQRSSYGGGGTGSDFAGGGPMGAYGSYDMRR